MVSIYLDIHTIFFLCVCVTVTHFALQSVHAPRGSRELTAALCSAAALAAQDLSGPPATGRLPGPGPAWARLPIQRRLASHARPHRNSPQPAPHDSRFNVVEFPLWEAGPIPIPPIPPLRWVSLHSEQIWFPITNMPADFALAARQGVIPIAPLPSFPHPPSIIFYRSPPPTSSIRVTDQRLSANPGHWASDCWVSSEIPRLTRWKKEGMVVGRAEVCLEPGWSLTGAWLKRGAPNQAEHQALVPNRPAAPGSGRHRGTSKVTGSMTGDGTISAAGGRRGETIDLHPLPT